VQRPTMRTGAIKRIRSLFLLGLHEDVEEAEASSHCGEYPRKVDEKRVEGSVVHIDIKTWLIVYRLSLPQPLFEHATHL